MTLDDSLGGKRSDAFRLVARMLSDDPQTDRFARSPLSSPFWFAFSDVALDQLVAPAIGHRINELGLTGIIPSLIDRQFDAMLRVNRSRNERLRVEALELGTLLNAIDVVPTFTKGSAGLVAGLYTDPGMRIMSDLDVLIPKADAERALEHLIRAGYKRTTEISHPKTRSIETLIRKSRVAPVDLHHEVLALTYQDLLPANEILKNRTEITVDGVTFAVPSSSHQAILSIANAQLNDHGYWFGNLPLRTFYDLLLLMKAHGEQIDWQQIRSQFDQTGNARALNMHLYAAHSLLGLETPLVVKPGLMERLLFQRAIISMGFPSFQKLSMRFVRVFALLHHELSNSELRSRLLKNMTRPAWWRRHLRFFWRGVG